MSLLIVGPNVCRMALCCRGKGVGVGVEGGGGGDVIVSGAVHAPAKGCALLFAVRACACVRACVRACVHHLKFLTSFRP